MLRTEIFFFQISFNKISNDLSSYMSQKLLSIFVFQRQLLILCKFQLRLFPASLLQLCICEQRSEFQYYLV